MYCSKQYDKQQPLHSGLFLQECIMSATNFVVLDVETTGLDPMEGRLLSVGAIYLNAGFQPVSTIELDLHCPDFLLESLCDEKVMKMHKKSGLWDRCIDSPLSLAQAQDKLLEWMHSNALHKETIIVGNNISFDRAWLKQDMPKLDKYLHYRMVDISSINEIIKITRPELAAQVASHKVYGHTGLADCYESLSELQLYLREVFHG